jgi:ribosomal protein S18 acetylase RimI-like enzyme
MSALKVVVREVKAEDFEAMADFFENNNVEEVTRHFHPFPLDTRWAKVISGQRGNDKYYIAVENNSVIGFGMLRGWDEGYEVPSLGVLVDLAHQNQGLGRHITSFLLTEAKKVASAVRLSVDKSNNRAIGLYRSFGFEIVAEQMGRNENIYIMKKEFWDAANSD